MFFANIYFHLQVKNKSWNERIVRFFSIILCWQIFTPFYYQFMEPIKCYSMLKIIVFVVCRRFSSSASTVFSPFLFLFYYFCANIEKLHQRERSEGRRCILDLLRRPNWRAIIPESHTHVVRKKIFLNREQLMTFRRQRHWTGKAAGER